jgi:hypothetical protein
MEGQIPGRDPLEPEPGPGIQGAQAWMREDRPAEHLRGVELQGLRPVGEEPGPALFGLGRLHPAWASGPPILGSESPGGEHEAEGQPLPEPPAGRRDGRAQGDGQAELPEALPGPVQEVERGRCGERRLGEASKLGPETG